MILTSANTLENKEIVEYKGLVTGESLIGANIYKDLFSGVPGCCRRKNLKI